MSQAELYRWLAEIGKCVPSLGRWLRIGIGLYSFGMMLVSHNSASRVAEGLGMIGKPESLRRRFERVLASRQFKREVACAEWSRWVLGRLGGQQPMLLVDETKLGRHLRVMVVGLAWEGCCIPLAFQAYQKMPCRQVTLITNLLRVVAAGVPVGCCPVVQADRGIGTSPALIRAVEGLGWQYLFRVQNDTRLRLSDQQSVALVQVVQPGGRLRAEGLVFKKFGWLATTVLVIWDKRSAEPWCLVTNAPSVTDYTYGLRYWQEAAFRDLKSDGWQWQTSRVWTPDHAHVLLFVMTLAYAYTLSLGALVLDSPVLSRLFVRRSKRSAFSIFRLGLRLFRWLTTARLWQLPVALPCPSPAARLCVGL